MIKSGLLSIPWFPFLICLEKEYWRPVRVGGWMLGIEDVMCSFSVAALVWVTVALPLRNQIIFNDQLRISWCRYGVISSISVMLFLLFYLLEFSGMGSLILASGAVATLLLIRNRQPWPLFITGIFLYPVLYLVFLKIVFWIWPDFVTQWNHQSFWGATAFLGVPLGEIAWAVIFGAYGPLVIAYVLDFRLSLSNLTLNFRKYKDSQT